ncbi:DDE-type integrase/transposase/recombinase [Tautonia marina]|uniref:DDE-type integrase/transposase/recombinase n=1 Tax=Tautonia marina TaxID=2653855 RepID=UPI001261079B|nr:DDE-type integrase/transposase/recombinase [Tautonia marina]
MATSRGSFTAAFKAEVERRVTEGGESLTGVTRETWASSCSRAASKALATQEDQTFPGKENLSPAEEELRRLRGERWNRGADWTWTADIASLSTRGDWSSLAAVNDLRTRRIGGWSRSERIESRLVVDPLEMAIMRRMPGTDRVADSDRGSQYPSEYLNASWPARGSPAV